MPELNVAPSGGALQLDWPGDGTYFSLYSATNITPPVAWTRVTNSPVLLNERWQVTVPTGPAGQRFFRFQHP
jgi:hypothetical protein